MRRSRYCGLIFTFAFKAALADSLAGRTFPIALYLFDKCGAFWSQGDTSIIADGECQHIPLTSAYTPAGVAPGPYYRAIPDETGETITFRDAQCYDANCTNCEQYSSWLHGPNAGVFNMTEDGCQNVLFSSFITTGKGELIDPPTAAPATAMPTTDMFDLNATEPMPSRCEWAFRYYNESQSTTFFGSCSVFGLIAANERATIVPDGECHDSGTDSVGFYLALCDPDGGIIFLKNKCYDSTCMACDEDSDVYTETVYEDGECYNLDSSIFHSWVLQGSCFCEDIPTSSPQFSTISASELP